jgi:hypothetical protein
MEIHLLIAFHPKAQINFEYKAGLLAFHFTECLPEAQFAPSG